MWIPCWQGCVIVMIYSGSDFREVWFRFRIQTIFCAIKKIAQNLAYSMLEAAYFLESWPLVFDF